MRPLCATSVRDLRHAPQPLSLSAVSCPVPAILPHRPLEAHFLTGSEFSQLGYHLLKIGLSDG